MVNLFFNIHISSAFRINYLRSVLASLLMCSYITTLFNFEAVKSFLSTVAATITLSMHAYS